MKKIIIIWFLIDIFLSGFPQIITIKDQENYRPLELVTLSSNDPMTSAVTNVQGQADMTAFKGADEIEIRLIGYKTLKKSYDQLEKSGFQIYLSTAVISLDQVVISATRWNQSKKEIPTRITAVAAKKVILENPQTAADLLGISGEVFIQKSQQGGGSPMIRGFATNRLLIVVDGVRMNTAIFRSGNLQNVISLDPFATERTEVLFGPGSVIYGSDAIGGVMNFYTRSPGLSTDQKPLLSGNAAFRYFSANNEFTGHVDLTAGWKKWAFVTSFSQFHFDNLRMGSNGPDEYLSHVFVQRVDTVDLIVTNDDPRIQRPTGYSQTNVMQKIRYKPGDNLDITYGFHYSVTSDYSRYDRLIRFRNGLPGSAEWYYGPQVWMMNNLNITHHASSGLFDELTSRLAHQFFKESRIDRDFNDPERRTRIEKVNAFSANIDFKKAAGISHQLFYGLEAVYDDVNSTGTDEDITTGAEMPGPARYPQANWSSWAAYFTWQYKMTENLLLQAGARYNQFILNAEFDTTFYPFPFTTAKINNGALTGSLGLVYYPSESWSLSANFSSGFRSPNVDDIGKVFDSEPGSVVVPNPDLHAEYAWNAESGIVRIFGEWLKIDLTGFYTLLDNALVRRDFTMNGLDSIMYDGELSKIQAIQNAARAYVWGIQTGFETKLPAGFGFSSRFNYQKGEEELDDGITSPLRHAAPWFGMTHLTYSAQKLILDLYAVYNGEVSYKNLPLEEQGKAYMYAVDGDGNPYCPGWYTLNFKAMYQVNEKLSVSGGVENISNQRYRPFSSGIAGPGRNFILAFRAIF